MSTFDFHVHCYPEDLAERAVAAMSVVADTQTDGTWDQQLAYMSRHDVSHCVGLNMAKTPGSMHKVNLFAVSSMRPQQLIFGSVHPQADNVMEELEWLYEQGIRGVKLHTCYQHFYFDDPAYFPIYRKIGELGMATTIHCGPFFEGNEYRVWPSMVARAIDQFRGAPFICAHMGGVHGDHPEFSILKELPVYVDTALADRFMSQEQFARMVQELGDHRVLFGTDMPWQNPEDLIRWINPAIASCPEINAQAIYYDNAMELCRRLVPAQWKLWQEQDEARTKENVPAGSQLGQAWYNVQKS